MCGRLLVRAGVSSLTPPVSPLLLLPYHSLSPFRAELRGAQRISIQWASKRIHVSCVLMSLSEPLGH